MGLSIATEIFQQNMHAILGDIPGVKVVHDDVLIATIGIALGKTSLTECLNRIKKIGMTLNKTKCLFLVKEVEFFGMSINKDGVKLKKEKIADLRNAEEPSTLNELHSFFGSFRLVQNTHTQSIGNQYATEKTFDKK